MQSRIRWVASWFVLSPMCMVITCRAALAAAVQESQSALTQDAVSGEWLIMRDAYGSPLYQKMTLKLENGKVTGNLAGDKLEGTLVGNALHFIARDEDHNTSEFTGTLSAGTITGTIVETDGSDPSSPPLSSMPMSTAIRTLPSSHHDGNSSPSCSW